MPKVKPLGNKLMQASAAAKTAGKAAVMTPDEMQHKFKQLLSALGLDRREQLADTLNMPKDRLDYIARSPEACKLNEAIALQKLGEAFGVKMFDAFGTDMEKKYG